VRPGRSTQIARQVATVLVIVVLVAGLNGCGGPGNVVACPQKAWSKGRIERLGGTAWMETRQSFNWNSTGLDGTCVGYGTEWVGLNSSYAYTYCKFFNVFPYFADCNSFNTAANASQNDYKSSDAWGNYDWNVTGGDSGRVNIHTYVQGFKSGNAHTHCWLVALDGSSGRPWGDELACTGGNS
jgi:hypothetical protein